MQEIIKIKRDDVKVDTNERVQDWILVANGIVWECWNNGGWSVGYRNEVIVDLTVATHLLGLDSMDVLEDLIEAGVIDPYEDDENTRHRMLTVLEYDYAFDWSWAIDPETYRQIAVNNESDMDDEDVMPVKFVLD